MEIKVRNVDVLVAKKLDALAKEQGVSREAFLRDRLNQLAHEDLRRMQTERVEELFDKNIESLQTILLEQNKFSEKLTVLESVLLTALEVDVSEINELFTEQEEME
ncbi:hypothetical protein P9B03_02060 [Metasolibacillus meyeri]|uniref:Ribbon-helix-helix protein CopG domain-containing protein n=1 Tax=Metasolibacillus meyeri TaxID=1071052 RepID=A0AAW9NIK7_9BACL|nr:hypothetical protein [Metasolibacillus meyeri]MEC1177255.1 hypothetical protein [Metasolibacillus meyeri]